MRVAILLLLAVTLQAQQLPSDLWKARHRLNTEKYSLVEFKDTVVLHGSFLDYILGRDVREQIRFQDISVAWVDRIATPNWHGKILSIPGCIGTQSNDPQGPFYFEDRSVEGLTIRGKAGMIIKYNCTVFVNKVS